MHGVRDARRALARGNTDQALVDLWNALEPLRLGGNIAGLQAVAQTAAAIAETGDGSQAREASRLLQEVSELLASSEGREADAFVDVGTFGAPQEVGHVGSPPFEGAYGVDEEVAPVPEAGPEQEPGDVPTGRSRTASLVWALILGAFVIFNIIRGLLAE